MVAEEPREAIALAVSDVSLSSGSQLSESTSFCTRNTHTCTYTLDPGSSCNKDPSSTNVHGKERGEVLAPISDNHNMAQEWYFT